MFALLLCFSLVYVTSPDVRVTSALSVTRSFHFTADATTVTPQEKQVQQQKQRGHVTIYRHLPTVYNLRNTKTCFHSAMQLSTILGNTNDNNGNKIQHDAHKVSAITQPEKCKTLDPTWSFLKDVLVSVTENPIIVAISNFHSAHMKMALISVELVVPVVMYGMSGIHGHEVQFSATRSSIYVILLYNTDVQIHINLLKDIKEKDYTGKVLFLLDDEEENVKIMEQISRSGYYEIYFAFLSDGSNYLSYEIRYLCAYCNNGAPTVNIINYWEYEKGFKHKLQFPPSFKRSFNGANVRVATNLRIGQGIDYDLLLLVMDRFNFTLELVKPKTRSWGSFIDGKWTGIIGMIYYNSADLGMGWVSITSSRFSVVNPTSLLETESFVMVSRKPKKSPRWMALVEALSYEVWILLIISTFTVGLTQYCFCRFIPGETPIKVFDALFAPFQILCVEPWKFRYPGAANIILQTGWMLACMLIISFYVGSVQSILLTPRYSEKPVDTIEKLKETDKKFLLQRHTSFTNFLLPTYNLFDHAEFYTDIDIAKEMVLNNSKYVMTLNRNNIYRKATIALEERNPFHFGSNELTMGITSWMVRKNCPFRDDISKALMDAHRFGFIKHYTNKLAFKLKDWAMERYGNKVKDPNTAMITFTYAWKIIQIFLWMDVFCVIILIMEISIHKIATLCNRKYAL